MAATFAKCCGAAALDVLQSFSFPWHKMLADVLVLPRTVVVRWAEQDIMHQLDEKVNVVWFCLPQISTGDLAVYALFASSTSTLGASLPPPGLHASSAPAVTFFWSSSHLGCWLGCCCPDLHGWLPQIPPVRQSLYSTWSTASCTLQYLPVLASVPDWEILGSLDSLYISFAWLTLNSWHTLLMGRVSFSELP